jgi:hypothetical protein
VLTVLHAHAVCCAASGDMGAGGATVPVHETLVTSAAI